MVKYFYISDIDEDDVVNNYIYEKTFEYISNFINFFKDIYNVFQIKDDDDQIEIVL